MNDILRSLKKSTKETTEAMDPVTICFGIVTKANPLEITVEQRLPLKIDDLILTRAVSDHEIDLTVGQFEGIDDGEEKYTFPSSAKKRYKIHNKLEVNDVVTLLRVQGGQRYVVIDKEWIKDDTVKQQ